MPRLRDRNRQTPGGHYFYDPYSKWKSKEWDSFDQIVSSLIDFRKGNPSLTQQYGASTDRAEVEEEVDAYISAVCLRMGWNDFITPGGGDASPKTKAPMLQKLGAAAATVSKLAAGYKAIKDWKASEDPPVPIEIAERRAEICAECPMNKPGDFTAFFTVPLSEAIRRDIAEAQGRGLKTPSDDNLHVCSGCQCPIPLMVHIPIEYKAQTLTPEIKEELRKNPKCWVIEELGRL